ncbi:MAG: Druantia anti-phage system protein DruA [Candidatus Deferrimicrobiaceae bacterium]
MPSDENAIWWQGDREISPEDIAYIRRFTQQFPGLSRKELTCTLCEHLDWLTPAGHPKFTACAKLLARLEKAGELRLPALRKDKSFPGRQPSTRRRPGARTDPAAPFVRSLSELEPVQLRLASDAHEESLWNDYIERYHPLGYKKPFGYWARYFIDSGAHRLGCLLFAGAAKALTARDRWIGWTDRQRLKNLPWVVNNSRYLIFPWVEVANLASHVLGQLARQVGDDWERRWGYRPLLLETFVDPAHFAGSCYRAAGWTLLGRTTGEGLVRPGKYYRTRPKLIFAKPLQADFRRLLCGDQLTGRTEL